MPEHIPPRLDIGGSGAPGIAAAARTTTATAAADLPIANSQAAAALADVAFSKGKTVFIDNYDSFTYNIVQVKQGVGLDGRS